MRLVADATSSVDLWLSVPIPLAGGGWKWGVLDRFGSGVLGTELVYNCTELVMVLRAYCVVISRMIRTAEADRFLITATGEFAHARAEWGWVPSLRGYQSLADPWIQWGPARPVRSFLAA